MERAKNDEAVFAADGADFLRAEAAACASVPGYIADLLKRKPEFPLLRALSWAASVVELRDRDMGPNRTHHPISDAFLCGGILALRAVEQFVPEEVQKLMTPITANIHAPGADERTAVNTAARKIVKKGEEGYDWAENYHDLLTEWEDFLCDQPEHQRFIGYGFGWVFEIVQEAQWQHGQSQLRTALEAIEAGTFGWGEISTQA